MGRKLKPVWICVAISVAVVLGACGGDGESKDASMSKRAHVVRDESRLPDSQIDTLRAMRVRYNVTRDEYWPDYGGVLGNAHFDIWYPIGNTSITHAAAALKRMDEARVRCRALFGDAELPKLTVVCSKSLPWYEENTGQTWWHYSRLTKDQITLQPMMMLYQRGIIDVAIKKEYFRWEVRVRSKGHVPMWVEYGFAAYLADENAIAKDQMGEFQNDPIAVGLGTIDKDLAEERDKKRFRIANYNALRMIEDVVAAYGEDKVGKFVVALGTNGSVDSASKEAFGVSYDQLVTTAMKWQEEPRP